MTHNMTEMIVTERNTYSETESAHCHTVDKEMARCTQGVGKVYPRCIQVLGKLMSMLRSSLGAGKEQLRRSLEYAYSDITSHGRRDVTSLTTRRRSSSARLPPQGRKNLIKGEPIIYFFYNVLKHVCKLNVNFHILCHILCICYSTNTFFLLTT